MAVSLFHHQKSGMPIEKFGCGGSLQEQRPSMLATAYIFYNFLLQLGLSAIFNTGNKEDTLEEYTVMKDMISRLPQLS